MLCLQRFGCPSGSSTPFPVLSIIVLLLLSSLATTPRFGKSCRPGPTTRPCTAAIFSLLKPASCQRLPHHLPPPPLLTATVIMTATETETAAAAAPAALPVTRTARVAMTVTAVIAMAHSASAGRVAGALSVLSLRRPVAVEVVVAAVAVAAAAHDGAPRLSHL